MFIKFLFYYNLFLILNMIRFYEKIDTNVGCKNILLLFENLVYMLRVPLKYPKTASAIFWAFSLIEPISGAAMRDSETRLILKPIN